MSKMDTWERFLDSFATRGGAIGALVLINGSLVLLMLHMVHRGEDKSAFAIAISQAFGNFSGALLMGLKGGDKVQRATPMTATVTTADPGAAATITAGNDAAVKP